MSEFNPYVIILVIVTHIAVAIMAYNRGGNDRENMIKARSADITKAIEDTREQARLGTAQAISQIHLNQVTIKGRVEHEIETHTVYRDCVHTPDSMRLINAALQNQPISGSDGSGQLPAPDALGGSDVRGHDGKAP